MVSLLINGFCFVAAFLGMEGVAWLSHKYLMHGPLWILHKDHHHKETDGFLERNDFFFLIFAVPGIICLFIGLLHGFNALFWTGLGITAYGFAYFFIHDIFIHQRFGILKHTKHPYFLAIRRAHKLHHKHLNREGGECFGMLWIPRHLLRKVKNANL
jgi:beta-carotene 3-hydroxylase